MIGTLRLGRPAQPRVWVGFLVLLVGSPDADAHPISVVAEAAFVDRDKVTIEVEAFAEDLYFYHELAPNDRNEVPAAALRDASHKHGTLLLERLPVFDASGRRLGQGRVVSIAGNEFPKDIPVGELMGTSLFYGLEYPLGRPPEFLSFSQRLVEEEAGFPALVDFRVKQAGRDDEVEATLKPGNVRTVRFDWSTDASPLEKDGAEWLQAVRDDRLGAAALNSVRSFLYVARREVRHELLMPVPLLESYFTIDRQSPETLTPAEQDVAKQKVGDFFRGKNPITIDGEARVPAAVRVEFFTLEQRDLTSVPARRAVSAINARVGIILSYPLERPADEVKLIWNAFNRQAWRVDAFCFAGDEVLRPKFSMATRSDTFEWKRPEPPAPLDVQIAAVPPRPTLSVPWFALLIGTAGVLCGLSVRRRAALAGGIMAASIALAGAVWNAPRVTVPHPVATRPVIREPEADEVFRKLHDNLYLAVEAGTDDDALEALAAAADGELLRELYLRLIRTFREADESGAVPVTEDVAILEGRRTRETASGGFEYSCRWEVAGRVEHWGHVHTRRYRYDALFRVEPRSGRWALTALDLRDARLVKDASVGLL